MAQLHQLDLFGSRPSYPEGFEYRTEFISTAEEEALVPQLRGLPLRNFQFHGFEGKRRVVSFGWRYDFDGGGLRKSDDIPDFLLPLRRRAAAFAGLDASAFQHVHIIEYAPGAGIGWHRDKPEFDEVVGISFLAPCDFRFRRRQGTNWERITVCAEPRSAYLLAGPARTEWEHSIPAVDRLRLSVTFRNLR